MRRHTLPLLNSPSLCVAPFRGSGNAEDCGSEAMHALRDAGPRCNTDRGWSAYGSRCGAAAVARLGASDRLWPLLSCRTTGTDFGDQVDSNLLRNSSSSSHAAD